ncbi:MAG: hypothetical protein ACXVNM_02820 [Bacteroidia bacterium]
MKKIILLALGVVVIRQVAKYFKINTFDDVVNLVKPFAKEVWPRAVNKVQNLSHSLN